MFNIEKRKNQERCETCLSLTKIWINMSKKINDNVLLRELSDGDVAAKKLYYHKHNVKAYLKTSQKAIQFCGFAKI